MSEELKPCPFCGGEATLSEDARHAIFLACITTPWVFVANWNRRAAPAMPSPPSASAERNVVLEEAALACDFQESWSKGESEDDQYPESTRKMFRTQQFQSETCAAAIRALKSAAPVSPGQAPQPVHQVKSVIHPKGWHDCEFDDLAGYKRGGFITRTLYTAPIPAPAQPQRKLSPGQIEAIARVNGIDLGTKEIAFAEAIRAHTGGLRGAASVWQDIKRWQDRIVGAQSITQVNTVGLAMQDEIDDLRAALAAQAPQQSEVASPTLNTKG